MSTAQLVPETWELSGDDARETLKRARFGALLRDGITRFRSADGMSHARSLAFAMILTVVPGIILVIGIASFAGAGSLRDSITEFLTSVSPGPTGEILTAAISQGAETSAGHGPLPMILGLIAMAVSGCTVFGQIERAGNRIYGIEEDRPFVEKYRRALAMFSAYFAGALLLFVLFQVRPSFLRDVDLGGPAWTWTVGRLLIVIAIVVPAFALIFKLSPRRRQPGMSWLAVGSSIATVLWLVSTGALALFWAQGSTFGETYGPLAGVIGLALWAYLIAIGLLIGLSFAAQLEAVRAGCSEPQDEHKVEESEPDAEPAADPSHSADAERKPAQLAS